MPRVLMFGTGAIGGLYAYVLCKSPSVELTTVCRSNYDVIHAKGLLVDSEVFGQNSAKPDNVVRSCEEAVGPFDYVLVTAKALPGTAGKIKAVVGDQTAIVLIQNGIFIEDDYCRLYSGRQIVSCSVNAAVNQPEPGRIRHQGRERLIIGAYPKSSSAARDRAQDFTRLVQDGGATATFTDDVQEYRWDKVAANAALNPLCALTRLPDTYLWDTGRQMTDGLLTSEQLARDIIDEIGKVAAADGYIEDPVKQPRKSILLFSLGRTLEQRIAPSMLQDVRQGTRLEVEAILGNVVRKAQAEKISVPKLAILYVLTKGLDRAMEEKL